MYLVGHLPGRAGQGASVDTLDTLARYFRERLPGMGGLCVHTCKCPSCFTATLNPSSQQLEMPTCIIKRSDTPEQRAEHSMSFGNREQFAFVSYGSLSYSSSYITPTYFPLRHREEPSKPYHGRKCRSCFFPPPRNERIDRTSKFLSIFKDFAVQLGQFRIIFMTCLHSICRLFVDGRFLL